jgi:hypothetical protein
MSDYERERHSKKYKSTTTYVEIWKKFNTFIDSKKLVDLTTLVSKMDYSLQFELLGK